MVSTAEPRQAETTKTVPLIKPDLPSFEDLEAPLRQILSSGRITNFGEYVNAFEREAGEYLGTHVASTSSGTAGLLLTMQALGLQPGEKVIMPSFTFMATAQATLYAGGVPLFAEIGDDLTISPGDLEALLAAHDDVALVIPVHMYGLPARTEEIEAVVRASSERRSRPIRVLYDAAHAFGSSRNGRRVGSFGDAEVFSLSVTKVLVSVEGGLVSSKDAGLIERIKKMRNYGIEASYDAAYPGLNSKMSEIHALVGLHNLRRLDELMAERQQKAAQFKRAVEENTVFRLSSWPDGIVHTFKDFTVFVPEEATGRRDDIMAFLRERGVETRAYFYPPAHEQKFFRRFADRPMPRTERLARRVITLPFFTAIAQDEMDYVVNSLVEAEREIL